MVIVIYIIGVLMVYLRNNSDNNTTYGLLKCYYTVNFTITLNNNSSCKKSNK